MPIDTAHKLELRWFDKLDQPTSGVRRLTDAYCRDTLGGVRGPVARWAGKVRKAVEATAKDHMADHINATK